MRPRILLLLVALPVVEYTLLARFTAHFGGDSTVYLVLLTAVGGFLLARRQGIGALRNMQTGMAEGRLPGSELLDGLLILACGALLILPGLLSDAVGLLGLIPPARRVVRQAVEARWERRSTIAGAPLSVQFGDQHVPPNRPEGGRHSGRQGEGAQRDISSVVERFQRTSEVGS